MKKYKIFISGVQKELRDERRAIKDYVLGNVLLKEHFDAFLFEDDPAKGKSSQKSYLEEVHKCDIYIGILGEQYGGSGNDGMSPTETEFREAQKKHKPVLIYIKGANGTRDKTREPGIRRLINEIKEPSTGYSYRRFNNTTHLTNLVFDSLVLFLREKGIVGRDVFDQRVCEQAKFTDIDGKAVKWFLKVAKEKRNFPLEPTASIEDVLTHLNLLQDGKLTNAAVLLFGKDPHKFFLQAEVKCIQFPSTDLKAPYVVSQ